MRGQRSRGGAPAEWGKELKVDHACGAWTAEQMT